MRKLNRLDCQFAETMALAVLFTLLYDFIIMHHQSESQFIRHFMRFTEFLSFYSFICSSLILLLLLHCCCRYTNNCREDRNDEFKSVLKFRVCGISPLFDYTYGERVREKDTKLFQVC